MTYYETREVQEGTPQNRWSFFKNFPLNSKEGWRFMAVSVLIVAIFLQLFEVRITPKFRLSKFSLTKSGSSKISSTKGQTAAAASAPTINTEKVLPSSGVVLPVKWGDIGAQLIKAGIIDKDKFETLYQSRGGISPDWQKILSGTGNGQLKITDENAGFLLNMLWALGLGNANSILEKGPMNDPQYGGADRFASTGGWPFAVGDVMKHYGKHQLIKLSAEQQAKVERVSQNIYRPCCNNSTYFPDCNHGMAMLGLLELMASQGVSEADMYKAALQVNSFWFPDTYLTLAQYFESQGADWSKLDPKIILGAQYSSASGYKQIQAETQPVTSGAGGGGCGA